MGATSAHRFPSSHGWSSTRAAGAATLAEAPGLAGTSGPPGVRLIDSHAHLQTRAFAADATEVLAAARAGGVERLLVPGFDLVTSEAGLAFARAHGLPTSAGVHPHVASGADEPTWERIRGLAVEPEVRAIGETGLDYDRALSPAADQLANLERHVDLALETAKPLILHCRSRPGRRDAQDALVRLLRAAGMGGGAWRERFGDRAPAVLHSFSGPVDYAEAALDLGLAISFSGLVFRRGEEASASVARLVPADRLLIETDSPYLSPPGARAVATSPAGWPSRRPGSPRSERSSRPTWAPASSTPSTASWASAGRRPAIRACRPGDGRSVS